MSLVGSLEDLGLGDILQIISLSRKSGVLLLRSGHGEGSILFREGRVTGAFRKGGPTDLGSLLVAAGLVGEADFAAARRASAERGLPIEDALRDGAGVDPARLESCRKGNVERAVFTMFGWPSGEFSFDVRDDLEGIDPALCVNTGIDAQYLAMEGARQRDEADRDEPEVVPDGGDPASFADIGAELRAEDAPAPAAAAAPEEPEWVVEPEPAGPRPADLVAEATLESVAGAVEWLDEETPAAPVEAEVELEAHAEPEPEAEAEVEPLAEAEAGPEPAPDLPPAGPDPRPIVVLDPELPVLEWAKAALGHAFGRIHIFQKTELAIGRIRQYVLRGEAPVILLAENAPPDPISGARRPAEIVERLHAQSSRLRFLTLGEGEGGRPVAGTLARAVKPALGELANPRCGDAVRARAEALVAGLQAALHRADPPAGSARSAGLHRLKQVSARLRDAAARGEVLPVVMRFAAEHFARVAMFLVRDEEAVGMAQLGLERAGGPDDAALRALSLPAREPGWFRAVLERGGAVRGAPGDPGDRRLAGLLGDRVPEEAYVAPLESGDRIVGLLYADNLPEGAPLGDTTALEVVLHEAGMALDRAALERQLALVEKGAGD